MKPECYKFRKEKKKNCLTDDALTKDEDFEYLEWVFTWGSLIQHVRTLRLSLSAGGNSKKM